MSAYYNIVKLEASQTIPEPCIWYIWLKTYLFLSTTLHESKQPDAYWLIYIAFFFFFFLRINGRFGLYIAKTYIFLLISKGNVACNRGMGMGNSCMEMKITFFKNIGFCTTFIVFMFNIANLEINYQLVRKIEFHSLLSLD